MNGAEIESTAQWREAKACCHCTIRPCVVLEVWNFSEHVVCLRGSCEAFHDAKYVVVVVVKLELSIPADMRCGTRYQREVSAAKARK